MRPIDQTPPERRIVIDEVLPSKRFVLGHDQYSTPIRASFDALDLVVAIPSTKEMWLVRRHNNEWRLERRVDTGNESITVEEMSEGDRRLEAPSALYLAGDQVVIQVASSQSLSITSDGRLVWRNAAGVETVLGAA